MRNVTRFLLVRKGKAAARRLIRARILLLAGEGEAGPGKTDTEIVDALGCGVRTVERVRKKFVTESLDQAISAKPQPPRPDKIKIQGDVEKQMIEIARSDPPEGRSHWTVQMIADQLMFLQCVETVGNETVRRALKKNGIAPWAVKTWCFPKENNHEFVWRMEDVLSVYELPYGPEFPVVCMDEASKQLIGEVAPPTAVDVGKPRREDYEYVRNGTSNQFMFCEPLRGWRHVEVTAHRTMQDGAKAIQHLVDVHYPLAQKIRLVPDNLNTHTGASLYATFPPAEAKRILDRLEIHYTPKHASWLNMAEIEIGTMNRQCMNRRIDDIKMTANEIAAWESQRNESRSKIHWTFTAETARRKMNRTYPPIQGG